MRVIFWGTPEFAIPSLDKIYLSSRDLCAIVTVTDKARGRGMKPAESPVKKYALEREIPVLQPPIGEGQADNLRDERFIEELKSYNADIFVIVAFKILPREIFSMPIYGSFNLHASLLPRFRGAAPIQWALIKGDKVTGVTTFKIEDKVDTGNVYLQKQISIEESDNFRTIHDKLSQIGGQAVQETLDLIDSGNFSLLLQDHSLATPAPKITKEICEIDWRQSAESIHNLIRGLSPSPCAFFIHNNNIIKILDSAVSSDNLPESGAFYQTKNELFVGCGAGSLKITELQREGKRKMYIDEFLRGYSFK